MDKRWIFRAVMFCLMGASIAFAQESPSAERSPVPAATRGQIACTGFINGAPIPPDLYVAGGGDNEFMNKLHAYTVGDYVFLVNQGGPAATVGEEFRLVRREKTTAWQDFSRPGLGPLPNFGTNNYFPGRNGDLDSLGTPYSDVGKVRIVKVTPEAAIAKIIFNCTAANQGDIAIPYDPRPIPDYAPASVDRFASSNGKLSGGITASRGDILTLGTGDIGYISLGQSDGVKPGDVFRVTRILYPMRVGALMPPDLPPETVGQVVVLWTQGKSSVVIVVSTTEGVNVGDAVQLE